MIPQNPNTLDSVQTKRLNLANAEWLVRFGGSATDSKVLCFNGFGFKVFRVLVLMLFRLDCILTR